MIIQRREEQEKGGKEGRLGRGWIRKGKEREQGLPMLRSWAAGLCHRSGSPLSPQQRGNCHWVAEQAQRSKSPWCEAETLETQRRLSLLQSVRICM